VARESTAGARIVPEAAFLQTHKGFSASMQRLINEGVNYDALFLLDNAGASTDPLSMLLLSKGSMATHVSNLLAAATRYEEMNSPLFQL
jgi:hypothetical protein